MACAGPPKQSAHASTSPVESLENQPALIMLNNHVVSANPARPSGAGFASFLCVIALFIVCLLKISASCGQSAAILRDHKTCARIGLGGVDRELPDSPASTRPA